jgi:DNA-binding NarL/FixJ family response regulator
MAGQEVVLVLTGNLFFLPRIEAAAEHFGLEALQASSPGALLKAAESRSVSLVLVDLEMDEAVWAGALEQFATALKSDASPAQEDGPLVIAYGPHGEPETLRKARDLGCDAVIIKRDFSERLPELLETRGRAFVPPRSTTADRPQPG